MNKFLKRTILFLSIGAVPILLLLLSYLYFDPFKVVQQYDDYSYSHVIPNKDFISTSMFLKNYDKYKYNSFLFGSSRTLAYRPEEWCKYIDNDCSPYLFNASGESIYGIYTKIKFLAHRDVDLKNVLILICFDDTYTYDENHSGHLFIKHYLTSGESKWKFHLEFFKTYIDKKFLFYYYSYKILGEYRPFMAGYIENRKIVYDTVTNRTTILDQEKEITEHPDDYYRKRTDIFYKRAGETVDTSNRINAKQEKMLVEIKEILEKNNTNYKLVISPQYNQKKFSPTDMNTMTKIFGNHLYDFSGANYFTEDIHNYYETSHYRPKVGDSILHYIYTH